MNLRQSFHPVCILLVLIILFFGKKLIPVSGSFIGSFDTELHFWNFHFIREQLFQGELPFWNPYNYCGQPFLANPVIAMFYPSTILFLFFPFSWAFNLDILIHLFVASTGAYMLVKHFTGLKEAGLASAVIYCLNGYFLIRIFTGHLNLYHATALIPWIFYYTDKYLQSNHVPFIVATGCLIGLQILSGDAQTCYYSGLALVCFCILRTVFQNQRPSLKKLWKPKLLLILAPVTAIGIGMIQMIPSMEFLSYSQRAENSYAYATYLSFPPENFFTFLVPHPKDSRLTIDGEFTGYVGILSLFLAIIGAAFSKKKQVKTCFGIILLLSITIILGHYTPFFQLYYKIAPLISKFRIPSRCMPIVILCIAVLAGFGVQHLLQSSFSKAQNKVCLLIGSLILLLIIVGATILQINLFSTEIITALGLTVCSMVTLFFIQRTKNKKPIMIAILMLLFSDLYLIYANKIPTLNQKKILKEQSFETILKADSGYDRIMMPMIGYNLSRGHHSHLFQANGYASVVIGNFYRFIHETAGVPIPKFNTYTFNPDLFQKERIFSSKIMGMKYGVIMDETGETHLFKASRVMPRVNLVKHAIIIPDLEDQIEFMKKKIFNPMKMVLLQEPVEGFDDSWPSGEDMDTNFKIAITQYDPNRIVINSVSEEDLFLVLSELVYPGWHAYIDGEHVPILRANFLLRSIPLKSGSHQIVFEFRPRYFFTGVIISTVTVLCAAIYLVVFFFYKRKSF